MTIYKKTERIAWIALGLTCVVLALSLAGVYADPSLASYSLACVAAIALGPALITVFHATMYRLAEQEREAFTTTHEESIFAGDQSDSEIKRRNLRQFESWMLPVATGIIAVVECLAGVYLLKVQDELTATNPAHVPAIVGGSAVLAVILYLIGSYLSGLAFHGKQPMLRAVAAEISLLAWLCGLYALSTLVRLTQVKADVGAMFGVAVAVLLLIRSVDRVISTVLEVYRPRKTKDGSSGLLYESKISVIVADPVGLLGSLSDALHYQFGIRISEQGLLRLITVGVPVVILLNSLFLILFSCIVVINPGEQAIVERYGKMLEGNGLLEPGIHVKMPWPVDTVYRRNIKEVKSLTVGAGDSTEARSLWTDSGAAAFDPFLAPAAASKNGTDDAGVNMIAAELFVQYRIRSIVDYTYNCSHPDEMLRVLARRQLTQELAGQPFFDIFLQHRDTLRRAIQTGLQEAIDSRQLGIVIIAVGWRHMQPPGEIAKYYQDVVSSEELRDIDVIDARREINERLIRVKTETETAISEAKAFRDQQVSVARADEASFTQLLPLYRKYGQLMKARTYFEVMNKAKDRRKIIIATENGQQIIRVDLKKSKSELFDFAEEPKQ